MMKIVYFVLGPFMTNTFVGYDEETMEGFIIDPTFEPEKYIDEIKKRNIDLKAILVTHAHIDHIAGLNETRAAFPEAKFYMDQRDEPLLKNPRSNLSFMTGKLSFEIPDIWIQNKDKIKVAGAELEVIDVAGHTPGGVAFYVADEKLIFTGDSLFQGSIGRTDFPGGSTELLLSNIKGNIFTLPEDTTVLPGHGDMTTVGIEKKTNPFFNGRGF